MKRSILMLEHDDDDRYITRVVFEENHFDVKLNFVETSNELFSFLILCEKSYAPLPALILLNHYATPLDAVAILRKLKSNTQYAHIPVVVLSGTANDGIIGNCYAAGASSFIKKPASATGVTEKISAFFRYWFDTVELV